MGGFEDILEPRGGSSVEGADLNVEPASAAQAGPFMCTINGAPDSIDAEVFLVCDGIDGGEHLIGPARWAPRVDAVGDTVTPVAGDEALVMFDDNGDPWVVVWWEA